MRSVGALRRRIVVALGFLAAALTLAGCETFQGRPPRLYSVAEELVIARERLPDIAKSYRLALTDDDRKFHRTEYIALRMYIIDAEFTEFESALTKERGEFGFTTALVTQGLTTAGAVFTPANTVRTLSALAGGVNASRGFYDSELLVNKTIQIVQAQMEAKRDIVAARIFSKVDFSPRSYPLSAALHDLEDYYRAGTLTSGLIKAAAEAGEAGKDASDKKELVMRLQGGKFDAKDDTMKLVQKYLAPNNPKSGVRTALLSQCLIPLGFKSAPAAYALDPGSRGVRLIMIQCAAKAGDPM